MSVNWTKVVATTDHRPWPLPSRPWVMTMTWRDLLLAHWPVAPDRISRTLPDGICVDTWDGRAWLTVVSFEMRNTMPRGATWSPKQFRFPELNLRTYVTADGDKPGVWFYSLDAASWMAVAGARAAFKLPYYWAKMRIDRTAPNGPIRYTSRRTHYGASEARFKARYRPTSHASVPEAGSFAEWLVERYCLYSANAAGTVFRADVHHRPWALCDVDAEIETNTLDAGFDFSLSGPPVAAQYAHRVDVVGWWPTRVARDRAQSSP